MKEFKNLMEIFINENICDYCNEPKKTIMRVIVDPIFYVENDEMVVKNISISKKCMACWQKDICDDN